MFHRGRLIDHIVVTVRDLATSRAFYEAVLAELGMEIGREGAGWFLADELLVKQEDRRFGRIRLAFQAPSNDAVDSFYDAGLEAGGRKRQAPDYDTDIHPYYYTAALADPDGNIVEAVCHGPVRRSAASVVLKPSTTQLLKSLL